MVSPPCSLSTLVLPAHPALAQFCLPAPAPRKCSLRAALPQLKGPKESHLDPYPCPEALSREVTSAWDGSRKGFSTLTTKIFTMVRIWLSNPFPPAHSESPCKRQPGSVRAKEQKVSIPHKQPAKCFLSFWSQNNLAGVGLLLMAACKDCTAAQFLPPSHRYLSGQQFSLQLWAVCHKVCSPLHPITHFHKPCASGCGAPCPFPSDSGSTTH